MDLVRSVRSELRRHEMLPAGGRALAAVSGGADSVALLLALHSLGIRLHVAHLDHGIRAESGSEARFVEELCGQLGLPCTVGHAKVQRSRGVSLETAAREARHAFLRQTAAAVGAGQIFLAHTADDQVETFLMRLIRGSGVAGLGGMRPKDGVLCRPMLSVWRYEVEAFLQRRGQDWLEDPSNRDRRFLRNRVRHELLPLLASMNPGIKKVLLREAAVLAEQQLSVEAEVLRRYGLGARQIGAALAGKAVMVKGGARLEPFEVELPVPGEAHVPAGRLIADVPADGALDGQHDRAWLDADAVGANLKVRNRRPGDRFRPLGMAGAKKLQDFLVDEKIPSAERDRVPIVTSDGAIVWVVGLRIDERFKVTDRTRKIVRLQFEPA